MFIARRTAKGRAYYLVRECYWKDGKPHHRNLASLGTSPTIEGAFRATEDRYFAAREKRKREPLTAGDGKTWDRLENLYRLYYRMHGVRLKLGARIKREEKERRLTRQFRSRKP